MHLTNPRDVVPESNMPTYGWLAARQVDSNITPDKLRLMRKLGVPYTDAEIAQAAAAVAGKSDMDALIAYLQGLGVAAKEWR